MSRTLADLVAIPSVNPDLVPGATGEAAIAAHIAGRLRRTPGIDVEISEAAPGRPNVVAAVGSGSGRTLMINGHTDTVGVEGMTAPFTPRIDGDRLYGRGASDMKGSLAAMILLLETVADRGDFPGRIVATFVADEEYASAGTQAICRDIERWQPDGAIVTESTDLEISVAHKGFIWADVVTRGVAAHGSRPDLGVDAIAHMGRVLVELERLGQDLARRSPHDYVGAPSVHASLIEGGRELSTYPDFCRLQIERRTIPGETEDQVRAEFEALLGDLTTADPHFDAELSMGLVREPFEVGVDELVVAAVAGALEAAERPVRYSGGMGWMDSALLSAAGVPTVIFGPGGEGAHATEEWADLPMLEDFLALLEAVAYRYCAG